MPGERRRDRQAVRLLSIFLLLLQGGRLTVHELAARFKTRRETIYRDLRTLGDVGIPIEGDESGRLSRPRLGADYRLRFAPVPLTRQEIAALAWAVKESHSRQPFQDELVRVGSRTIRIGCSRCMAASTASARCPRTRTS